MNVIGYVRVSTTEQSTSGLGLEAQEAAIRGACEARGWNLVRISQDVASGTSLRRRPELAASLGACETGEVDGIVVAKLDRLARSVVDAGKIIQRAKRRGFNVVALDIGIDLSTSNGRLVAHIMAAVAEWEAERISERQIEAKAVSRTRGSTAQVPDAVRNRIVELAKADLTQHQIASQLEAEGVPCIGRRWHRSTVQRVLHHARRQAV